ncbi:uncharacterized protein LOC116047944 [Sander lucioperca]|uniref:uncharacterized protein LOC116047944 n=1 Tax=Sander lucioperca TaxID=283035 RepID=UPI00125E6872|nr:uncharacterized protein LOC116047944 [Sander lucioperca]
MQQRGQKLLQSNMFLLLLRTSALALLLGLSAANGTSQRGLNAADWTSQRGLNAADWTSQRGLNGANGTSQRGHTCREEIHSKLLQDLRRLTKQLINKLPEKEKYLRGQRLLPKFCTKCSEHVIGWLEMREVMDVYQRSVFSREVVQELFPMHYNNLLYRLQHTLQHCVSSSKPSKWFKTINNLERKMKKRRRDQTALKAVGEFTYVLRWIDELAQHHIL